MDKREIEELRDKVGCALLLQQSGWKLDVKESTRHAVKYRRDTKIVIVIHNGRGWFDPLSSAKGDVFDLAEHLGARGFYRASAQVAALVGLTPAPQPWTRTRRTTQLRPIADRWTRRGPLRPASPAWRYLTETRGLPDTILDVATSQDALREGPHGSMWAAHRGADGMLRGWEERGAKWRGFATGGSKELFWLGPLLAPRICITEAAIDAMSLAAIEVLRPDTLYVSTGGGWSPASEVAIRELAVRTNTRLVAATDNNRQGDVYAVRIRAIAEESGAAYVRSRPRADDWNEDLKALLARLAA
ncbi:DUF3991 and toprim domain-containing protein [Nitrobacter sp.]|uniref:DUF3991 and toprim domain-containing protein n=1 Tax=Nitrobacter sp. TaxID=29420 RepID=UPI0029CAC19C|nr:DUF3991 and toprim domain-containing protein [Nitrobacter sp.]